MTSAVLITEYSPCFSTDPTTTVLLTLSLPDALPSYTAADVMNKITPADISDPQEVIARAKALSVELATPPEPGFEARVVKASRGIADIDERT